MKQFDIISIFPDVIRSYSNETILGRAQEANLLEIRAFDLRDYTKDKHRSVDDAPYGGGPGMVMSVVPIYEALEKHAALSPKAHVETGTHDERTHTILLSPRGREFTQRVAEEFARDYDRIVMVCGRYEGVDQRVADFCVDEEVSIGKYVLAGGELGALVITEAVSRLVPGVLGNEASLAEETFGKGTHATAPGTSDAGVEYPQYTRPESFQNWKVPDILLSGHHGEIQKWREAFLKK